MRQRLPWCAVFSLWCLVSGVSAQEQQLATVLILPFENATQNTAYAALSQGIPDLLSVLLSASRAPLRVVERDRLDAIVREKSLTWQRYASEHPLQEIGQLAQARYILRGSVTALDTKISLQALLYETESARLVKSADATGDINELTGLCHKIAEELSAFVLANRATLAALPVEEDPEKSRLLIEGLGEFYNGRFHQAFAAFLKLRQHDPKEALATYWLGRSFSAAGLMDHAAVEYRHFLQRFPDHAKAGEVKALVAALNASGGL